MSLEPDNTPIPGPQITTEELWEQGFIFRTKRLAKKYWLKCATTLIAGPPIVLGWYALVRIFLQPKLEVIEFVPVCIVGSKFDPTPIGNSFGFGGILRCRDVNGSVFVSGVDIVGRKYLNWNEWLGSRSSFIKSVPGVGIKQAQFEKEIAEMRPYKSLSWGGWIADSSTAVRVEPGEERFIKVLFMDAHPFYYATVGTDGVVGIEKPPKPSTVKSITPNLIEICDLVQRLEREPNDTNTSSVHNVLTPRSLRHDFVSGSLSFQIRANDSLMTVKTNQLTWLRKVDEARWKTGAVQQIFFDDPSNFKR